MARRHQVGLLRRALVAMAGLAMALPLAAQSAPPAANPPVTAAPAPTDNSLVGPEQLRDFTLNGTVTRPAEPAATPPPTSPRESTAGQPIAPSAAPATARTTAGGQAPPTLGRAAPVTGPDRNASPRGVTVELAPPSPAEPMGITPSVASTSPAYETPAPAPTSRGSWWPWLAAALAGLAALVAGGSFAWRRYRAADNRYAVAGVTERTAPPAPRATPPTPRSASPPPTAPPPAARAPVLGGIVASGLKPKLAFELQPLRVETDSSEGAALLFDIVVINHGGAPARDVLVEAQLLNAGAGQDEQIGRFFREPVGKGDRLPIIPPLGRVSIKTRLTLAADQMQPIEYEGRRLFVPLVAFNALYRWSGGEAQDSASFLVGRGDAEGEGKMAPFRLDQGAKSWTGLGARPHSMGLSA